MTEKQRSKKLANISESEYAELDKMIAEARRREGQDGKIGVGREVRAVPISGLGYARVYVFYWFVDGKTRGVIGWRPYGADEEIAAFQAHIAKYFSDGVNPKSVILTGPDGREERLR